MSGGALSKDLPRIAWVTGAGSGIGAAIALALAERGTLVAATSRSLADLEALAANPRAGNRITPFAGDVTQLPEMMDVVRNIETRLGPIDLALFSAGGFVYFGLQDWSAEKFKHLLTLNVVGVATCIEAVLPRFLERNRGHLAAVSSMAQYRGLPRTAGYGASKAALLSMFETLRMQTRETGLKVQIIVPGPVKTRMSTSTSPSHLKFTLDANDAADRILAGLASRTFEILLPKRLVFRFKATRWLPSKLYFWYASRTPLFGGSRP